MRFSAGCFPFTVAPSRNTNRKVISLEDIEIRPFERRDREAVRNLCCDTGYLGQPIDPVFEDRELFADYLTSYYTDKEPESSWVVVQDGVVKGYLLGSRRPMQQKAYDRVQNVLLFLRGVTRFFGYRKESRDFVLWILRDSWKEVPITPSKTAHFHFNLLPEVQSVAGTRALLGEYFDYLRAAGEKAVFGQVVTFSGRRGTRLFERYGFQVLERREITKYRTVHPEPVYLTTVVKNLDTAEPTGFRRVVLEEPAQAAPHG